MKDWERKAIRIVADQFSATWRPGDDPPDAWLTIAGKQIAVQLATLSRNIGSESAAIPRLRFDKVALGLVTRLQTALNNAIADGRTVLVTVTAPIRQDSKTTVALEQIIRAALTSRAAWVQISDTIQGNQIQIRVIDSGSARAPKLVGFIHNPNPDAAIILLDSAEALLKCILAQEARRAAGGVTAESWLVIAVEDELAPIKTWQQICAQLFLPAQFKRTFMVFATGAVGELGGQASSK